MLSFLFCFCYCFLLHEISCHDIQNGETHIRYSSKLLRLRYRKHPTLTLLHLPFPVIMPKADNSVNPTVRGSGTDSGVTGPVPLVPAHRELLHEVRSTVVPRPYFPTARLLDRSSQRVHPQTGGEPEGSLNPSNQEPQPPLPEWSHSRGRVPDPTVEPQNADSSPPNDPSVCACFSYW